VTQTTHQCSHMHSWASSIPCKRTLPPRFVSVNVLHLNELMFAIAQAHTMRLRNHCQLIHKIVFNNSSDKVTLAKTHLTDKSRSAVKSARRLRHNPRETSYH